MYLDTLRNWRIPYFHTSIQCCLQSLQSEVLYYMDKSMKAGRRSMCGCGTGATGLPKAKRSSRGLFCRLEPSLVLAGGRKRWRSHGVCRQNLKNYNFIYFLSKKQYIPIQDAKDSKVIKWQVSFVLPYAQFSSPETTDVTRFLRCPFKGCFMLFLVHLGSLNKTPPTG